MLERSKTSEAKEPLRMDRRRSILRTAAFWVGLVFLVPAHFIFEMTREPWIRLAGLVLFGIGILLIFLKITTNLILDLVEYRQK